MSITHEQHIERHRELHRALDELVADFIGHTGALPSRATVMEFLQWSASQMSDPREYE